MILENSRSFGDFSNDLGVLESFQKFCVEGLKGVLGVQRGCY